VSGTADYNLCRVFQVTRIGLREPSFLVSFRRSSCEWINLDEEIAEVSRWLSALASWTLIAAVIWSFSVNLSRGIVIYPASARTAAAVDERDEKIPIELRAHGSR
jgi:hypothetical protein